MLVPLQGAANGFHVVYSFQSATDGYEPHAGVINDSAGNLYGTTFYGGNTNLLQGTVFKLAPVPRQRCTASPAVQTVRCRPG